MKENQFARLLALLNRLDQAKIPYKMRHSRLDAIMIVAFAPGQYWEIELLQDGDIDIERYRSNGHIDDESVIEQLFALWSGDETITPQATNSDDAIARK